MATLVTVASGTMTDGTFPSVQCNVGGNHYITTGDIALDGATTFTITGWVKKQVSTNVAIVGSKGTSTTNQFYLAFENGRVRCNVSNTANTYGDYTMTNDTNWHFLAMVYDGAGATNADRLKLYVDGTNQTLTFTGTIPSTAGTNANPFDIGRYYPSGAASYGDQYCSHVTVHSTALSSGNISTLYNSGSGVKDASVVGTLINGWLLNEGSGTIAYDYAPSVNSSAVRADGTLTGATWSLTTGVVTSGTACFAQTTIINTDSEASSYTVTTTPTNLSTFTSTNTFSGVLLHPSTVSATPTGTFTVIFRNVTDSVDERTVTINVADLSFQTGVSTCRTWVYFKFSSNYTGVSGKTYAIRVSTSSATQVTLYGTASTATSVSAYGVITTVQLPMVGDRLLFLGGYTGAGANDTYTITTNDLTMKPYGQASTTVSNVLGAGGRLKIANVANKTHYFRQKGYVFFDSGGGITAISSPESTCYNIWDFDIAVNVDGGIKQRAGFMGGDTGAYELPTFRTTLTADASAGATSLTVGSTTSMKAGGLLGIGASTRTFSQFEQRTISSIGGATSVTVTSGLTNAHSGTSPANTEVFNLTRNFKIGGESISLQAFIDIEQYQGATMNWRGVEFFWMGSATSNQRGIDIKTGYSTVETNFIGCSFRDFGVASSTINVSGTTYDRIKFQDCVFYNFPTNILVSSATTGSNNYFINCGFMGASSGAAVSLSDAGWNFQGDNVISSASSSGLSINESGGMLAISTGTLRIGNCGGSQGIILTNVRDGVLPTLSVWRCSGVGIGITGGGNIRIPIDKLFGNTTDNVSFVGSCGDIFLTGPSSGGIGTSSGDTTFSTTNFIRNTTNGGYPNIYIDNIEASYSSGILNAHTNDVNIGVQTDGTFILRNSKLNASTEVSGANNLSQTSYIMSQDHDQVVGALKIWTRAGIITSDTTIFDSGNSIRITPSSATVKVTVPVGQLPLGASESKTINIKVRTSVSGDGAAHNGSRARLIMKSNPCLGSSFNSDIVCDTATASSDGAWETLTYTTPTATNKGIVKFVIDTDGTAGWVNYDTAFPS